MHILFRSTTIIKFSVLPRRLLPCQPRPLRHHSLTECPTHSPLNSDYMHLHLFLVFQFFVKSWCCKSCLMLIPAIFLLFAILSVVDHTCYFVDSWLLDCTCSLWIPVWIIPLSMFTCFPFRFPGCFIKVCSLVLWSVLSWFDPKRDRRLAPSILPHLRVPPQPLHQPFQTPSQIWFSFFKLNCLHLHPLPVPWPYLIASHDRSSGFCLQWVLYFQMHPGQFPSDAAKIALIISLLSGKALNWVKGI